MEPLENRTNFLTHRLPPTVSCISYICCSKLSFQKTFGYHDYKWGSSSKPYQPEAGVNLDENETLLATYWSAGFAKVCLGMKLDDQTRWIAIERSAQSLKSLTFPSFSQIKYTPTNVSVLTWKSLMNGSFLEVEISSGKRISGGREGHWGRWPGYVIGTKFIFSFRKSDFRDVRTDYNLDLRILVKQQISMVIADLS